MTRDDQRSRASVSGDYSVSVAIRKSRLCDVRSMMSLETCSIEHLAEQIRRVSLARENEAGGRKSVILHVNT